MVRRDEMRCRLIAVVAMLHFVDVRHEVMSLPKEQDQNQENPPQKRHRDQYDPRCAQARIAEEDVASGYRCRPAESHTVTRR